MQFQLCRLPGMFWRRPGMLPTPACLTCVRLLGVAWPVASVLPDSAPAEHSGWHDEASELLRCVSVHIVLDLVRTVRQCLVTCCHVWTCSCSDRVCVCSYCIAVILTVGQNLFTGVLVLPCSGCRLIACCFTFSAVRSKCLASQTDCIPRSQRLLMDWTKCSKVVTVAQGRYCIQLHTVGNLPALEATCWLCLEVSKHAY